MGQTQGKAPEGFDEARETRAIKRLKVDKLRLELESRGKDASGTAGRLRTRLLEALREDAMDVDVGDGLSPLSDDELLALVRKQSSPRISTKGSRLDWITALKARNVLDAHGHFDPRLNKPNTIIFERDIKEHPEDEWWVTGKGPMRVNGEKIMVASTRGAAAPGGGTKNSVPVKLAAHASKVLALANVPKWKREVWDSAAAVPFKAEAEYILEKPAPIVEHGCTALDAKGTRLVRHVDGSIVSEKREHVDGVRWVHRTVVRTSRLAQLREAERVGARMCGVADAAASLAAEVLDDPGRGRAALLALCRAHEAAVLQKARAMNGKDAAKVTALLRERDVDLSRRSTYAEIVGMDDDDDVPILVVKDRTAMHLINNRVAVQAWRRHASTGGRLGQDEQKNAIAEALRRPGWKIGDEKTEMHNILVAAMPYLKEKRFRWVLDYLVSKAQIDHIFSGVTDHVSNLMVEFAGPNGHFSDFTNCPGKAARYGAEVMAVAAEWVRQAIEAALDIVSYSKESA